MLTNLIKSIIELVKGIINSKSNIRASIIRKEVNVPTSAKLSEMSGYIDQILNDGIDTTDATATEHKLLDGETAYVNDRKIVGTMPNNGSVTLKPSIGKSPVIPEGYHDGTGKAQVEAQEKEVSPALTAQEVVPDSGKVLSKVKVGAMTAGALSADEITISSSGVITAKAKVSTAGYLASGQSVTKTKTLPTVSGKTVTPSTSNKLVAENGTYATGDIYVEGDSELKASNIKSGVSIFGVTGTCKPRITKLSGTPMSFVDTASGVVPRCTIDTTNLVGFFFADQNTVSTTNKFVSGFVDVVNKTASISYTTESNGVYTQYTSDATIDVQSNYVDLINVGVWCGTDKSERYWVVAIYS